jgi:hypothetical protein
MLTYFTSASNEYTIRTGVNTSTDVTMSLQDMTTLTNSTASLNGISINTYESLLSFTASISGAIDGEEYRAFIYTSDSNQPIWNGSISVFHSQSVDKPSYKTQINDTISHDSNNEYIIIR